MAIKHILFHDKQSTEEKNGQFITDNNKKQTPVGIDIYTSYGRPPLSGHSNFNI